MAPLRNIFACLVHESPECVIDLVHNLHALDPSSVVLLYNGGNNPRLLDHGFPFQRYAAVLHPTPRPQVWGRLHDFALDCMRFALANLPFDTLTIVDSDQLAARSGYSEYVGRTLAECPRAGMLVNSPAPQPRDTRVGPAAAAFREFELWRPFLQRFSNGIEKFAHWCFWPSTVFTAAAALELTALWQDEQLQGIMGRSQIWASEEVLFPTLTALLGHEIAPNPCSYDYVRYRATYTSREADAALARGDVYWIHPIARRYDDGLRQHVRSRLNHYETTLSPGGPMPATTKATEPASASAAEPPSPPRLLLTWPVLQTMRQIEGWLEDDEADLLLGATRSALETLSPPHAVVEVGSYCGRSTVVLGSVVRALSPAGKVYAVDPHDGRVGALDTGIRTMAPTLERFRRNIAAAGLSSVVEEVRQLSHEVVWDRPISLLLIDGLHDYVNVSRDFRHFEPWVEPGGLIAFHDYADYYPGVKTFVNEMLRGGDYAQVQLSRSLMVVQKLRARQPADREEHTRVA